MDSSYDIALIGAGLAGAFAAFNLSSSRRVIVLEKERPASGASGAGAGLVNPFMARKANPVWRWRESLDALEQTMTRAGCRHLFRDNGVFRPAMDTRQVDWFAETAGEFDDVCTWLPAEEALGRWPSVEAPHGGLLIRRAGSIELPALVESLLDAAVNRGAEVHSGTYATGLTETMEGVVVQTDWGDVLAGRVVLCVGSQYRDWGELSGLNLHPLKGQTIVVRRPFRLGSDLPCLSGSGYVVPYPDHLVLGSTHRHEFDGPEPTAEETKEILQKVSRMMPALKDVEPVAELSGVRVTVPRSRLPLVGPVSERGRVWAFTGLGSKGVLMAALLARQLGQYLSGPDSIPAEISTLSHPTHG